MTISENLMRALSRGRKFCAVAFVGSLMGLTLPLIPPAAASVNNASIQRSYCSKGGANGLDWRGRGDGGFPDKNSRSLGQTAWCATTYKIRSGRGGSFDYYAIEMSVDFVNQGISYPGGPATVTVSSNKATQDNYFHSSPGQTSTSCKELPLGVQYKVLSATIPFKVCDSAVVAKSSSSAQGATYRANDVSKVKTMSFVFMQKVKTGVRPTFSGRIRFPFYIAHEPDAQHSSYWYTYSYGETTWGMKTTSE